MSARPFQVGDPVLIDGTRGKVWWIDGPNPDDKFNGDYATAYIIYDEVRDDGTDGTAVIMTPDLTASKYSTRTLALIEPFLSPILDEDDGTEAEAIAVVEVPMGGAA